MLRRMGRAVRKSCRVSFTTQKRDGTYVQIRVETATNPLKDQNAQHRVDKVWFQLDVVLPYANKCFAQQLADVHIGQTECVVLDTVDDVANLLHKPRLVQSELGRAAAIHQQLASPFTVKRGQRTKKIQEVALIHRRKLVHEPGIKEDELR